ncbi:ATP-utilizing phosphoenolpyruvate carboxykinase [Cladochytrium replicatum]|nr:ATP-utilizing phosphoenolpyruvate carboxykinase [Cladochytrium replicatum]
MLAPGIAPWQASVVKQVGIQADQIEVIRNPSAALCYEHAIKYEPGSAITSRGALAALSGKKTGRSPADKRIVDEPPHSDNIWWGSVNIKLNHESFDVNRQRAVDYLNTRQRLYVIDAFAGWDPNHRLKIRVICSRAYHALFMENMLIRATERELETFGEPDFTIINSGQFLANKHTRGMTSPTSITLSFEHREMVILGSEYAGEMKKGVFTVMHYLMPLQGVLSLHASANEGKGPEKDVSLFFGLSGTGKTTLSADPRRSLIGDDEHCWSDDGIFNIEGGCYAKAVDLSPEKEPEIYNAIRFGSILENVTFDTNSRVVDFRSTKITENTRVSYPIEYIPGAKVPCVGGHPKNIVLLTCDAFGVLPPVSKLTEEQLMYHFISGYTAKIAGTEQGVTEPTATFSSCFGAPFLVWHPFKYATMLAEKLKAHQANAWLVNTGWTGGPYGQGSRIPLSYSRAIIDAIHSGDMNNAEYETYPVFGLQVPKSVPGVPSEILNPARITRDQTFHTRLNQLGNLFIKNFVQFENGSQPEIKAAGPHLE